MTKSKANPKSNDALLANTKTVKHQVVDVPALQDQVVSDTTHVAGESMVVRKSVLKRGNKKDGLLGRDPDLFEDMEALKLDAVAASDNAVSLDVIVAEAHSPGHLGASDLAAASDTTTQPPSSTVGGSVSEAKSAIADAFSSLTRSFLGMPAVAQAATVVGVLAATSAVASDSDETDAASVGQSSNSGNTDNSNNANQATVQGVVVAGPVIASNDLFVNAYSLLDGRWISSAPVRLEADGTFTMTISNWVGPAVFILTSGTGGAAAPDYLDEALGEAVDLPGALAAVLDISEGHHFLNISPLSSLVAIGLHVNLEGVDVNTRTLSLTNGTPWTTDRAVATQLLNQEVEKVATAFGLSEDEFNGEIAPAVSSDGQGGVQSATANKYGMVLAALSGLDYNSNQTATQDLVSLSAEIQLVNGQPQLSTSGQSMFLRGADATSTFTGLTVQQVATVLDPEAADVASNLDLATMDLQDVTQLAQISPVVAAFLSANQFGQLSAQNLQALTGDVLAVIQPQAFVQWQSLNVGQDLLDLVDAANTLGSITGTQLTALLANSTAAEKFDAFQRTGLADMFVAADFVTLGFASTAPSSASALTSAISTLENRWSNGVTLGSLIQIYSDNTPPTVAVASTSASLTAGATATINFTLSEASTNFTVGDVSVTGGTLTGFSGSGTSYSATFTKGATGAGAISVASGRFSDTAGNTNQDGSDSNNTVSIALTDNTPPTVAVASSSASLAAGATATINFTLSEASTNFTASDVTVTGGTLSGFSGSGTSYSATFTKGATGAGAISVASGAFSDAAGNTNQDGSEANNTVSIALTGGSGGNTDTTPPTVSVSSNRVSLLPNNMANISFTLSEPSTNFTVADVTVTGGTLSNFVGGGTTYFATFTKGATGTGTISVASGTFADAAGNTNQDGSDANNTVSIALTDNTPPTFTVTSNVSSLSTGQTGVLTFVFDEDVTMTLASMTAGYKPAGIHQYLAVTRIDNRNYQVEFSPTENFMQSNYQIEFGGYSNRIGATDGGNNQARVGYGDPGTTVTISIDTSTAYLDLLQKIGVDPADPAYVPATYNDFYAAFGSEFSTLTGIQNQYGDPSKIDTLNAFMSSMTRTNWNKSALRDAIQAISSLYDGINQWDPVTRDTLVALQITGLSDQNATDALITYIQNGSLQYFENWDTVAELQAIVDSDRSAPSVTVTSPTNITYQPTDSINVSSSEVGYVYLVRNGTNLWVNVINGVLTDNETSSFNNSSNTNKINKVQITQPGVTEQLSLSGLIGGDYRLFTVDAAGNKSAASTEVFSIPIVPPTVSVNSIYANNTGMRSNLPLINVSTNAGSGDAYLVPIAATIQNSSDLNNYSSWWLSNGVTNNWRLPDFYQNNFQPGEYVVYVKDSETGGISIASTNKIVVDNTLPVLTDASPSVTRLGIGGSIQARSNEQGYIYLLQQGMNQMPDPTSLLDNTSSYSRVQVSANDVGQNLAISTNGLQDGNYWIASVDRAGNWSDYSNFNRSVQIDNSRPDAPQVLTTSLGANTFVSMTAPQYEGVVYIVKNNHTPTTVAQIEALQNDHWNSIALPNNQRTTNDLPGTGLVEGTYNAYYSEASGNLSAASSTTILFDVTAPTVSYSDTRVAGAKRLGPSQTLRATGSFDFISSESGWAHLVDSNAIINVRSDLNQLNYQDRQSQQFQIVNSSTPVSFTLDYSNEGMEGTYKLYIEDSAGNISLANNSRITIDNTAPTVSLDNNNQDYQGLVGDILTNITIAHTDGVQVATAYLVHESRNPFSLSNILSYGDSQWNAGVASSNTQGSIDTTGLDAGRYKLYASDDVGNLSLAATHYVILG